MLNASPAAQNLVASYNGGKVSAQGMATAQNAAKASTIGLTIAQTALNAAIGMGIGLLINLVVQGVNKLIHANEEAIEKAEELRNKYEEFKNTNASNVNTLKGLESEFKELSKGVSQYGDNISLTTEQYERYKEIIQQIVGMSPSLAEGYDTENGYIADKNGLLERAIELQEIEYRNELRKITNLENLKTSMSGYIAEYKDALNGGIITDEGNIVGTTIDTDFKNSLWQLFNTNNRENYDGQSMAKDIMESLGIKDIDAEMQKYFNEYGYWQDSWFWNDYCDTIINNLNAVTDSLSFEEVGLDEEVFDQNLEKLDSYAESYRDMKDSVEMANNAIQTDLGYIAEYADGYSKLSTEQQKFVADFLKGFNISDITSENAFGFLEYDNDKMASVKSQIKKFVEELSQDESTKEALTDLYAIPTDEQSISEFVEQFRSALEIIKIYCEENGIEIPIAITDSEKEINGQGINTTAKVAELNRLASAYFGVANAIQISSAMGSDPRYYKKPEDYSKAVQKQWSKLVNKQTKLSVEPIKVKPTKTKKDSGSKNSKDSTKKSKQVIDWIERRLGESGANEFGKQLSTLEKLYSSNASMKQWEDAGFAGYFNDDGTLNTKAVEDKIKSLRSEVQSYINMQINGEKELIELGKQKYEAQKSYLQDIIDAKKNMLNIEKDIFSYERDIADKTKSVANLQKQINALRGDDSEEGRARLSKLQVSLDEAQRNLQDSEYDRYISDQQNMLDNLMTEYEDLLTNLTKDTDKILLDMYDYIKKNEGGLGDLFIQSSEKYGYATSQDLIDIVNALKGTNFVINKDVAKDNESGIYKVIGHKIVNKTTANTNPPANVTSNTSYDQSVSNAKTQQATNAQQIQEAEKMRKTDVINRALIPMKNGMGTSEYWTKSKGTPSSYVNQRLKNSSFNGNKILTEKGARALANTLRGESGFRFGNGADLTKKSKSEIFSALNDFFKASSFATGGIVDYKPSGEDGLVWAKNGEGFVSPEDVPPVKEFVKYAPKLNGLFKPLVDLPKIPDFVPNRPINTTSVSDVQFSFTLPNVLNGNDLIKEIQSNPKIQRSLQEVTLGQASGNGKLSVNRIR